MKFNKLPLIFLLIAIYTQVSSAQCQYLDLPAILELQDSLATNFPNICKRVKIGTSIQGRDIYALKFSDNVDTDEAEPEVLLTAAIHGDELDPEQVTMKLARQLCKQYNSDVTTTALINSREIWIVPVVNPDGVIGHTFGHRPNSNGVDLNRNFGYLWNAEFNDFVQNPGPNSETESKILRDFIFSRNFNMMIDYHSGLQGIIYPWYYKSDNCPDFEEISYLANKYDSESGYPDDQFAVTAGADLYPTNGAMAEFAYGVLGIYAFAVEFQNFPPPYTPCELVNINKPSIFMIMQKAGEGITGKVTDAETGNPLVARIEVDGKIPFYSGKAHGDYHRYLEAGTFTVNVFANGYDSKSATINVSNGDASIQDFELTPSSVFAAQQIVTSRNLNNFNDPALTWNALGVNDGQFYALGDTGYVVLDMLAPISDNVGDDLTVHGNSNGANNNFEILYSNNIDGPWASLGTGNGTTSFDLAGVTDARYIRLEDNGAGPGNVAGAGFNLDAITANGIEVSTKDNLVLNNVKLFPNPASSTIHIDSKWAEKIDLINIYNAKGQLINSTTFRPSIDVSTFINGQYFIQLIHPNSVTTLKFIKI